HRPRTERPARKLPAPDPALRSGGKDHQGCGPATWLAARDAGRSARQRPEAAGEETGESRGCAVGWFAGGGPFAECGVGWCADFADEFHGQGCNADCGGAALTV